MSYIHFEIPSFNNYTRSSFILFELLFIQRVSERSRSYKERFISLFSKNCSVLLKAEYEARELLTLRDCRTNFVTPFSSCWSIHRGERERRKKRQTTICLIIITELWGYKRMRSRFVSIMHFAITSPIYIPAVSPPIERES